MIVYGSKSANRIVRFRGGSLWQGGNPPAGYFLQDCGFDALVLCAKEIQPPAAAFPGVRVIHAPNDDDSSRLITNDEWRIVAQAAERVVDLVSGGQDVLVACHMGINRSGLVCALALHMMTSADGKSCVRHIRRRRRGALRNPIFVSLIETFR